MSVSRRLGVAVCSVVCVAALAGCAKAPPKSGLVSKLEQHNALSASQARCVADGLYDGMPDAQPALRRLTTSELRAVAKPDNAGKVSAEVVQIMRDVVTNCVPAAEQPVTP